MFEFNTVRITAEFNQNNRAAPKTVAVIPATKLVAALTLNMVVSVKVPSDDTQ